MFLDTDHNIKNYEAGIWEETLLEKLLQQIEEE